MENFVLPCTGVHGICVCVGVLYIHNQESARKILLFISMVENPP